VVFSLIKMIKDRICVDWKKICIENGPLLTVITM